MAGIGKLAKFAQKAAKTLSKTDGKWGKSLGYLKNADGSEYIGRDGKRIEIFKRTTRNGLFGKKQTITSRVYEGEDEAFVRTVQQGKKDKMSYSIYSDGRVTQSRVNTKTGEVEARTQQKCRYYDENGELIDGDFISKEVTGNNNRTIVQHYSTDGTKQIPITLEKRTFESGNFGVIKYEGDDAEAIIIKADKSATYRNTWHKDADGNWGKAQYDAEYGMRPYNPPTPAPAAPKAKQSHRGRNITLGAIGLTAGVPIVFSLLNNKDNNTVPTEPVVTNDSIVKKDSIEVVNNDSTRLVNNDSIPVVNNDSTQLANNDSIPAANNDSIPVANNDSIPAANNDSIPVANNDSIPAANNDSIPVANNDSIPAANNDSIPVANNDSIPVANNDSIPVEENDEEDNAEEQQPPAQQTPPANNLFNGEIHEITKASVEIVKGDCLWNIAKRELQAANPGKTITNAQILKQVKEFGRLNPEMFGENPSLQKLDLIYPDKQLKLCA